MCSDAVYMSTLTPLPLSQMSSREAPARFQPGEIPSRLSYPGVCFLPPTVDREPDSISCHSAFSICTLNHRPKVYLQVD
ncbi:hypothetical protein PZA11_000927 [Diplocarpon coronariae]